VSDGKLHVLPLGPAEEAVLVAELRQGEPAAYEMLYHRFGGRVLGVTTQILGDRASAQDAVQETFLKVFCDIHRFRGEGRLVSWIHRIAVNHCLSELRRRKRAQREQESRPAERQTWIEADLPETALTLLRVLDRLEPIKRATFYLHHVEGLSGAELAKVFGESRDAVLKRLQRTRRELLAEWQAVTESESELELKPESNKSKSRDRARGAS
jgi:RNA polymerase sigma-70 factor (ECF subfamily)